MDSQTRQTLKQPDQFVSATEHSLNWARDNRAAAIRYTVIALVVLLLVVGSIIVYNVRSSSAQQAFGNAMQVYQTDIAEPGMPTPPGVKTFASVEERAKAAHTQFQQVADSYSMTPFGGMALYFSGLTALEANQTSTAEAALQKASSSWNHDVSSLAKLALATLYHQTAQDAKAIDLYNQLIAKPTRAVPAPTAQLQLAALYEAKGQTADARKLYAQIKDKEAKTMAGSIAEQKLNPGAPQQPQF